MKQIYKKIAAAEKAWSAFESRCDNVLELVLPHFGFEIPDDDENFFTVSYQPSDGIVLADKESIVYDLYRIIEWVSENGKVESYEDLIWRFSI